MLTNKTFCWLLLLTTISLFWVNKSVQAQVAQQDSLALVQLYEQTGGETWIQQAGWLTERVEMWHGIKVSTDGTRVTEIALKNNNLAGSIDALNVFDALGHIDFSGNSLSGTIPNLDSLSQLIQIDFSDNLLTGTIPKVAQAQQLQYLFLSGNQLSGTMPDLSSLAQLQYIDVSDNQLSGSLPAFHPTSTLFLAFFEANNFTSLPNWNDLNAYGTGVISIQGNKLGFDQFAATIDSLEAHGFIVFYEPQQCLPIYDNNDTLYVDAGGDILDNIYRWYKDSVLIRETQGNNSIVARAKGLYTCKVTSTTMPGYSLCSVVKNVDCLSDEDCVMPGDANGDGLANHLDLLNIGLAYGTEGPARADTNTDWESKYSDNWGWSFANGLDYKHANTNGDTIIDIHDRAVIYDNYLPLNEPLGNIDSAANANLVPLYFDIQDTIYNGEEQAFRVYLGTDTIPVEDIHGIGFTMEVKLPGYSVKVIESEVAYNIFWLGAVDGQNMITLDTCFKENARWDVAMTRIDQGTQNGNGLLLSAFSVMEVELIEAKEFEGEQFMTMQFRHVHLITNQGVEIPVNPITTKVPFQLERRSKPPARPLGLKVYPNPTSELLFTEFPTVLGQHTNNAPWQIRIYDMTGRIILQERHPADRRLELINVAPLKGGQYMLEVTNGVERFIERVMVVK